LKRAFNAAIKRNLIKCYEQQFNLIEVANSGNVVLPRLPEHGARVGDDHRSVPQHTAVFDVPLQYGRNDHHVVAFGQLLNNLMTVSL